MSVSLDNAKLTLEGLDTAAALVTPRALRYELRARAREWRHVVSLLDRSDDADDAVIELASGVGIGMDVLLSSGFWQVVRVIHRDRQITLHVEDQFGASHYLNLYGPSSPVVVRA